MYPFVSSGIGKRFTIMKTLILVTLAIVLEVATSQFTPRVTVYSSPGCIGQYVGFQSGGNIPSLSAYGFNDLSYSTLIYGPWIFYELDNYNQGIAPMEYIFEPSQVCVNFRILAGHASSLRSVGNANDFRAPSITFYTTIDFQGDSEYISQETGNLYGFGNQRSLILTGQEPWTIYDQPFYNGNALCLVPEPSNVFAPSLIPNFSKFNPPIPIGSVASVRKGCWTQNVVNTWNKK